MESCSALMAGSLRAGTPRTQTITCAECLAVPSWRAVSVPDTRPFGLLRVPHPLAVPSWRAVSVPGLYVFTTNAYPFDLQCPHGGQSPCRRPGLRQGPRHATLAVPSWRAVSVPGPHLRGVGPQLISCSALMAGSLRAGQHRPAAASTRATLQCPHGGQSPCRRVRRGVLPDGVQLAVPSWRAVSVPAVRASARKPSASCLQCPHGGQSPCRHLQTVAANVGHHGLAVPSWRAVSVPGVIVFNLYLLLNILQCPHGGQSPCRLRDRYPDVRWADLQCPHGGQSPCRPAGYRPSFRRFSLDTRLERRTRLLYAPVAIVNVLTQHQ